MKILMAKNSLKKTIILTGLLYLLLYSITVNASVVPVFLRSGSTSAGVLHEAPASSSGRFLSSRLRLSCRRPPFVVQRATSGWDCAIARLASFFFASLILLPSRLSNPIVRQELRSLSQRRSSKAFPRPNPVPWPL